MKFIKYLFIGVLFGITMTKSEVISWYRIQEMFRFDSFHMYGTIFSAIGLGIIITTLIKKYQLRNVEGSFISFTEKKFSIPRYLFGGIVFGLGWALSGACPGPMYTLIGNGHTIFILSIFSAIIGTYFYGVFRKYLPH